MREKERIDDFGVMIYPKLISVSLFIFYPIFFVIKYFDSSFFICLIVVPVVVVALVVDVEHFLSRFYISW